MTVIHIAVNGTAIEKPGENPMEIMYQMQKERDGFGWPKSEKLGRNKTGGSTALWVVNNGVYMLDTGVGFDAKIMLKSIRQFKKINSLNLKEEKFEIYLSHTHQDHIGNAHLFKNATCYVNEKDILLEAMLEEEVGERFKLWEPWYERSGIRRKLDVYNNGLFTKYNPETHQFPEGLTAYAMPGHERTHEVFKIEDPKGITIQNIETGKITETNRPVWYIADVFVDECHLQEYLTGDSNLAIAQSGIPTWQHPNFQSEEEREQMRKQSEKSMEKLLKIADNGLLIFGHSSKIFDLESYSIL